MAFQEKCVYNPKMQKAEVAEFRFRALQRKSHRCIPVKKPFFAFLQRAKR